jgi:hypothetical protein
VTGTAPAILDIVGQILRDRLRAARTGDPAVIDALGLLTTTLSADRPAVEITMLLPAC